jgi:hypothetical protein
MSDIIRGLTQQQPRQQNSSLFNAVNSQASGAGPRPQNSPLFNAVKQQASPPQARQVGAPNAQPVGAPVLLDPIPPWELPKEAQPPKWYPYRPGMGHYDERDWQKARDTKRLSVPVWNKPYNRRPYNPFTPLNGQRPMDNFDPAKPVYPRRPPPYTNTGVTTPPATRNVPVMGPPSNSPTTGPQQVREGRWL